MIGAVARILTVVWVNAKNAALAAVGLRSLPQRGNRDILEVDYGPANSRPAAKNRSTVHPISAIQSSSGSMLAHVIHRTASELEPPLASVHRHGSNALPLYELQLFVICPSSPWLWRHLRGSGALLKISSDPGNFEGLKGKPRLRLNWSSGHNGDKSLPHDKRS